MALTTALPAVRGRTYKSATSHQYKFHPQSFNRDECIQVPFTRRALVDIDGVHFYCRDGEASSEAHWCCAQVRTVRVVAESRAHAQEEARRHLENEADPLAHLLVLQHGRLERLQPLDDGAAVHLDLLLEKARTHAHANATVEGTAEGGGASR